MLLAGLAALVPAGAAATASANTPGYQISLMENASTMVYGGTTPSFRITLVAPTPSPGTPNYFAQLYLTVDGRNFGADPPMTAPGSFLVTGTTFSPPLPVGPHSVYAQYSRGDVLVMSDPVVLTVVKATPDLQCDGVGVDPYASGQAITITMQLTSSAPVDWQNGTFAMTFRGTQTFTVGGLTANGSEQVVAAAPAVPDVYQPICSFSGTPSFNAAEAPTSVRSLTVTANHPIGGIRLQTDPADLASGVSATWTVTVLRGPGLPAPTGPVSLRIGSYAFSQWITLTGGGSVTFQTTLPALAPNNLLGPTPIRVLYHGDTVYVAASADFPMSNSAPSGLASSPQAAPAAGSQPTSPNAAASSDPAASSGPPVADATPGTGTPEAAIPPPPGPINGAVQPVLQVTSAGAGRYWAGAIAIVTLVGLSGGLVWWRRRPAGSPPEADA
jgi:hypothetical protein